MRELSVFVDESGEQGGHSRYYVLSLVFHDQADDIAPALRRHATGLATRGLPDVPFHAGPVMTGHDAYKGMDVTTRKSYLTLFFIDVQHLPVRYHSFAYRRSEVGGPSAFVARMRRDVTNLLFDNLAYLQSFDAVKIYYDGGQPIVSEALRAAFEYVLFRDAVVWRRTRADEFFLEQAADLVCALELAALKFADGRATRTDEAFFGTARRFRNNYMKPLRRKLLGGQRG